jgi:elongation factor 1-beta
MASVIVTLRIMPAGPDKDLDKLKEDSKKLIFEFTGDVPEEGKEIIRIEEEPIGFGIKALKIIFVYDESKGGTDDLEEKIGQLEDVASVETIDVRRALG